MDSITVSLAPALEAFVDVQVADGGFDSASDYIAGLIRADEQRKARERLETLLLDGLASPESPWTNGDMDQIRASGRLV